MTVVPGTGRRDGVPEEAVGKAVVYNVAFAADARTNTVIACGPDASIALIEVLVT